MALYFVLQERKRPEINNGSGTRAVPSTLTTRTSPSSVAPYVLTHGNKMYVSPLSPSTPAEMASSIKNIIRPSTPSMVPSTLIPEIYVSLLSTSTLSLYIYIYIDTHTHTSLRS